MTSTNEPVLIAQGLIKQYPDTLSPAVKGLDLEIRAGEVFGLLGPNGAGKSTTVGMCCGLVKPSGGRLTLLGQDALARGASVKPLIGLIPQEIALYDSLSIYDNIEFFGRLYGLGGQKLRESINNVLGFVGLVERRNSLVKTLSGGMQRRANIAAGLIHNPAIVFMDEPTVGVDPQSRNLIFDVIATLKKQGTTIIYITHYMEEAQQLCDRVAIIDQGKVVALNTTQALIQVIGGEIITISFDQSPQVIARLICECPQVLDVVESENHLQIKTSSAQQALGDILKVISLAGLNVTSLQILESNLETVFLQLTGKQLRD